MFQFKRSIQTHLIAGLLLSTLGCSTYVYGNAVEVSNQCAPLMYARQYTRELLIFDYFNRNDPLGTEAIAAAQTASLITGRTLPPASQKFVSEIQSHRELLRTNLARHQAHLSQIQNDLHVNHQINAARATVRGVESEIKVFQAQWDKVYADYQKLENQLAAELEKMSKQNRISNVRDVLKSKGAFILVPQWNHNGVLSNLPDSVKEIAQKAAEADRQLLAMTMDRAALSAKLDQAATALSKVEAPLKEKLAIARHQVQLNRMNLRGFENRTAQFAAHHSSAARSFISGIARKGPWILLAAEKLLNFNDSLLRPAGLSPIPITPLASHEDPALLVHSSLNPKEACRRYQNSEKVRRYFERAQGAIELIRAHPAEVDHAIERYTSTLSPVIKLNISPQSPSTVSSQNPAHR